MDSDRRSNSGRKRDKGSPSSSPSSSPSPSPSPSLPPPSGARRRCVRDEGKSEGLRPGRRVIDLTPRRFSCLRMADKNKNLFEVVFVAHETSRLRIGHYILYILFTSGLVFIYLEFYARYNNNIYINGNYIYI